MRKLDEASTTAMDIKRFFFEDGNLSMDGEWDHNQVVKNKKKCK